MHFRHAHTAAKILESAMASSEAAVQLDRVVTALNEVELPL
jgi:hypothetical protein